MYIYKLRIWLTFDTSNFNGKNGMIIESYTFVTRVKTIGTPIQLKFKDHF